jgi:hypothetical protein
VLDKRIREAERKSNYDFGTFSRYKESIVPVYECEDNSLAVFDDFVLEKQNNVRDYFSRGRHTGADVFCSCQNVLKGSQVTVEGLCLFRHGNTKPKQACGKFLGRELSFEKFGSLCNKCWDEDPYAVNAERKIRIFSNRHNAKDEQRGVQKQSWRFLNVSS